MTRTRTLADDTCLDSTTLDMIPQPRTRLDGETLNLRLQKSPDLRERQTDLL